MAAGCIWAATCSTSGSSAITWRIGSGTRSLRCSIYFAASPQRSQVLVNAGSGVPNLGASGAIAGVLAAYIILFPRGQVKVLMGRGVVPMPALVVIGLWIVLQFVNGIGSITQSAETGGVAYMAHIGGFVAGLVLTFLFGGRRTEVTA